MIGLERFDPDQLIKEVHEITETLVKIRAGTLDMQGFDGNMGWHDDNISGEDEEEEEDEGDFGISYHRGI